MSWYQPVTNTLPAMAAAQRRQRRRVASRGRVRRRCEPRWPHSGSGLRRRCAGLAASLTITLIWGLLPPGTPQAAEPTLWGYGVRGCEAYLAAATAAQRGSPTELARYEDWLAGFISALSLALGEDVLRDTDLSAAMRGARSYCRDNRDQDFFNAAMDVVQSTARLP